MTYTIAHQETIFRENGLFSLTTKLFAKYSSVTITVAYNLYENRTFHVFWLLTIKVMLVGQSVFMLLKRMFGFLV